MLQDNREEHLRGPWAQPLPQFYEPRTPVLLSGLSSPLSFVGICKWETTGHCLHSLQSKHQALSRERREWQSLLTGSQWCAAVQPKHWTSFPWAESRWLSYQEVTTSKQEVSYLPLQKQVPLDICAMQVQKVSGKSTNEPVLTCLQTSSIPPEWCHCWVGFALCDGLSQHEKQVLQAWTFPPVHIFCNPSWFQCCQSLHKSPACLPWSWWQAIWMTTRTFCLIPVPGAFLLPTPNHSLTQSWGMEVKR